MSRAVRDLVELRTEYVFHDGGEHQLKNVSRSVQVFHVRQAKLVSPGTTTRMVPQITLRFEGPIRRAASTRSKCRWKSWSASRKACASAAPPTQCELVVPHPTVSRRHAKLSVAGEALQVEDLGSTNGTAVNGTVLKAGAPIALQAGSKLRLGDVELIVHHT